MRIAYLANYQGADLVIRRDIGRNISLAGTQKIATLAAALASTGVEVTVFSAGSVAERSGRWHSRFESVTQSDPTVKVVYAAHLDVPYAGQVIGGYSIWRQFARLHRAHPFDAMLVYNCSISEVLVALAAARSFALPIILEYEDDVEVLQDGSSSWKNGIWTRVRDVLRSRVTAVTAPSLELLAQFTNRPQLLLRGALDPEHAARFAAPRRKAAVDPDVLFSGTIVRSKGVGELCLAWKSLDLQGSRLNIIGHGSDLEALARAHAGAGIVFHGYVSRGRLLDSLDTPTICVNPNWTQAGVRGNVFPFKILEYLGAGCPVVSTPLGYVEPELSQAILQVPDSSASSLASGLQSMRRSFALWQERASEAQKFVQTNYAPKQVGIRLSQLIRAGCLSQELGQ